MINPTHRMSQTQYAWLSAFVTDGSADAGNGDLVVVPGGCWALMHVTMDEQAHELQIAYSTAESRGLEQQILTIDRNGGYVARPVLVNLQRGPAQ